VQFQLQPFTIGFVIAIVVLVVAVVLALPGVGQLPVVVAALIVLLALARLV
jgi:hypothetical protein